MIILIVITGDCLGICPMVACFLSRGTGCDQQTVPVGAEKSP